MVGEIGVALAMISALILVEPPREKFAVVQFEKSKDSKVANGKPNIKLEKKETVRDLSII